MRNLFFVLCILFLISTTAMAKKPPTMPNSYNGLPLSAKSIAMGNTGAGSVSRTDNVYFNPAGIAFNTSEQIQVEILTSVLRDSDLSKNEINIADPTDLGLMSIVLMQKFGAISWRTLSSYQIKTSSGNNWYNKQESIKAVTLSVGNVSDNGSALGMNISYLYGTLSESSVSDLTPYAQTSSGNGVSLDIGITYPLRDHLVFGINFENIIGFMWWSDFNNYDQLPFTIKAGTGYYLGGFSLLLDYSRRFYRFGDLDPNLVSVGAEQYITSFLAVRAGVEGTAISDVSDKEKLKYTYGFGLNISILTFNFAAQNYKINSENVAEYLCSLKVNI